MHVQCKYILADSSAAGIFMSSGLLVVSLLAKFLN